MSQFVLLTREASARHPANFVDKLDSKLDGKLLNIFKPVDLFSKIWICVVFCFLALALQRNRGLRVMVEWLRQRTACRTSSTGRWGWDGRSRRDKWSWPGLFSTDRSQGWSTLKCMVQPQSYSITCDTNETFVLFCFNWLSFDLGLENCSAGTTTLLTGLSGTLVSELMVLLKSCAVMHMCIVMYQHMYVAYNNTMSCLCCFSQSWPWLRYLAWMPSLTFGSILSTLWLLAPSLSPQNSIVSLGSPTQVSIKEGVCAELGPAPHSGVVYILAYICLEASMVKS